jgi:type II secretory pathway component GspD/PulD (secretin)
VFEQRSDKVRGIFVAVIVAMSAAAAMSQSDYASTAAAASPARTIDYVAIDEPIKQALIRLGKQFGVDIVVESAVQGRVTATLRGASLDQALTAIVTPLGFEYRVLHGVVIVGNGHPQTTFRPVPSPTPVIAPTVLALTTIRVDRAASVLRSLFPHARITVNRDANALIAIAPADDIASMRAVLAGIDIQDPTRRTTEAIQLHVVDPRALVSKLRALYPASRIATGPNHTLIVEAVPADMNQIKAVLTSLDVPMTTPSPTSAPAEAIRVIQARPGDVATAISREYPFVRATVVGSSVVVSGSPDDVSKAKALIALIDQPSVGARFTQVYRLRAVDAKSVGDLISRSFHNAVVTVDADLNALSVTATASDQQRIADAIAQLDITPGGPGVGAGVQQPGSAVNAGITPGGNGVEVVTLKAAIPGLNQAASTSATDLATAVTQALQLSAPDLHITVPANSTQMVLTGSPYSIRLAKQLIDQLDVSPPQIVLDTEVLELDETGQKNVGLLLPTALSATYSEIPPVGVNGATPPPVLRIQPWTRTTLSAQVVLNALMTTGHARVLADPRITTISGHTASIRAGDTINYTTSVINGGAGSVVTQQVQSVQTGVTLDITPVVNANNSISVTLHPTVNSLLGTNSQGVPSIANREAQTTVTLGDNQTLVIGGLIQENESRTETTVPILGQIPFIGRIFHNYTVNSNRNELIIVVTPHILGANAVPAVPGPALPAIPTAEPLPTLPPGTALPAPGATPVPIAPAFSTPAPSAPPQPIPTPTAFAQANEFHFGRAPSNTYAAPGDQPQIFYALFSPTVLSNGTHVTVSVITTTNVSKVTIGYGSSLTPLVQVAPDKWQVSYAFNSSGFPFGMPNVSLALIASRADGAAATVQIPVSVTP